MIEAFSLKEDLLQPACTNLDPSTSQRSLLIDSQLQRSGFSGTLDYKW
jgi:hypothetical protein